MDYPILNAFRQLKELPDSVDFKQQQLQFIHQLVAQPIWILTGPQENENGSSGVMNIEVTNWRIWNSQPYSLI